MPLLADARRLYQGGAPVDRVYKGSSLVWSLPAQIPGCVLYLDARELDVVNGNPIDVWPDLSGAGNHAAKTDDPRRPVMSFGEFNGKPAVRFTGYSRLLTPPMTTRTFLFVTRHIPDGVGKFNDYDRLFGASIGGNPNSHTLFGNFGTTSYAIAGTFGVAFAQAGFTIDGVLTADRAPLNTPKVVLATGDFTQGPLIHAIGTYMADPTTPADSQYLNGWLAAVAAWDRVLTATERDEVSRWARNGWGTA